MITFETDLYVDCVHTRGEYDQKIDCRADRDETSVKYPQKITICIKKKNFDKFQLDFGVNDKIHVKLYPVTKSGVGKNTGKPFAITELIAVDLKIVERIGAAASGNEPAIDDCPF